MIMRLASSSLLPLLTSTLVTGCFANGDPGGEPDAGPDCGCPTPPIDALEPVHPSFLPEGGEVRLERFQLGPNDADAELAVQALFFTGQDPERRSLSGTPIQLREQFLIQGYVCLDYRDGTNHDNGKSQAAQDIVDTRTYYDVGATVTLTNAGAPGDVIELGRFLASDDPANAIDRSSGLLHQILYRAPEATPVTRGASYLPAIAGSPAYSRLDLAYGQSATGDELDPFGTPQIFMPPAFTLMDPAEADFYGAGALVFTRGQDLSITYDPGTPAPGSWPTIVPFIAFVNDTGMVEAYCFDMEPEEQDEGKFTVPFEVLDIVQENGGGHAIFGRMAFVAWMTVQDETRMDLIGIESKVSPGFVIQDARATAR